MKVRQTSVCRLLRSLPRLVLCASVLFTMVAVSLAQASDKTIIVIHAGHLFDSETGTLLPARDIIVKGNLIESVGESLPTPKDARVVDLSRYTVLPGLIDAHTHLLYLEDPSGGLTNEGVKALTIEGTTLRALHGAARAKTFLLAGITTVRDLGNSGRFGDVALRAAINDGSLDGPRMYVSGPGLSPEGGQFPGLQFSYRGIAEEEYRVVHGVEDARQAVRENAVYGANLIKIYSNNTPNPLLFSLEEMRAIVAEAHLLKMKVAAHATSDAAVARAVEAGVDSIEHGYQATDATLAVMKERGVALVPTYLDRVNIERLYKIARPNRPLSEQELSAALKQRYERIQRAIKAGVNIVAGSDNYIDLNVPQGDAAKRVLFTYHDAGMSSARILQSATINASRLIGEPRLGVIKAGAFADIIAVEGDPMIDFNAIDRVRFVMKDGKIYVGAATAAR